MSKVDNNSSQKHIKNWQELYGENISEETHKEICDTLNNLVSLLHKWNGKERRKNEV